MPQNDENTVPFSQDTSKPQSATRAECIADLMRLVQEFPDRVISRNFYRVEGSYAESAWTQHFGTFAEFKKQANVTPSRHVQLLEKHIAKHASTEAYKVVNAEKAGWEGAYLRPCDKRFQTHVVVTDTHDRSIDPFLERVLLDTIARVQPERIVLGGDAFDLPEFGKYAVDPREWDVVGRIRAVHGLLASFREAAPNAQLDLVEGNHEYRLLRHLAEASPAMRAVLSDLHGFTVPKLLGLDTYEVNYLSRSDLAAFNQRDMEREVAKNYLVVDDAYLVHHFPEGRSMGYPGMHGHHHKHLVWSQFSPRFQAYEWHQLGSGHRRQASYCAGEKWTTGFMLVHLDRLTKHVVFEYCDLSFGHAVVGGRWYVRNEAEQIELGSQANAVLAA